MKPKQTITQKIKRNLHLILVLSLLSGMLFLVSCGSNQGEKNIDYNFKQGIAELHLQFLDNAPPEKIYPSSQFKMILIIDNQEAYDVKNVLIRIIGLDQSYFSVSPLEQKVDLLLGRSMLNPGGDKIILEPFEGDAQNLFLNAEEYIGNYFVKMNYESKIDFADTFCIDSRLYEAYDSGCKVMPQKSYNGQGAPLAINNVEEIIIPSPSGSVEFRFNLKNLGQGKVGKVNIKEAKLGGETIECNFKGLGFNQKNLDFEKDQQQETIIICKKNLLEEVSSYMTTLNIELTYNYEIKEEHRLRMVK